MADVRKRLVKALRMLDGNRDVVQDTHGNVSCRGATTFLIKPSGVPYGDVRRQDIPEIILYDGRAYGGLKPSVDTEQHRSIYNENQWVGSICHTHSPYATAYAIAGQPIPLNSTEHADYFGTKIRCFPFAGLEWGRIIVSALERAILLEKHGTLLLSEDRDPRSVVRLALALEMVARKTFLAEFISTPDPLLPADAEPWHNRFWGAYGQ